MRKLKFMFINAIAAVQGAFRIIDVAFWGGLFLIAIGANRVIKPGAGFLLVGLLLVFYVKPLSRWL